LNRRRLSPWWTWRGRLHGLINQCFFCKCHMKSKCQCKWWSLKKRSNKGHTNKWSIDRFWSWWMLSSSLKLHKIKFVR
jgi:hypothetical protein